MRARRFVLPVLIAVAVAVGMSPRVPGQDDAATYKLAPGYPKLDPDKPRVKWVSRLDVVGADTGEFNDTEFTATSVRSHTRRLFEGKAVHDWVFTFAITGTPPATLRAGEMFSMGVSGTTGGLKNETGIHANIRIDAPGFKVVYDPAAPDVPGGNPATVSIGLDRPKANKRQYTFTVPRDASTLSLTVVHAAGSESSGPIVRYLWEKVPQSAPLPKVTPPPPPPPPPGPGLSARMGCGATLVIPEPTRGNGPGWPCDVCVKDWCPNTQNRVTVTFPTMTDTTWGLLPGGLQVFPGNTSADASNMHNAGTTDHPEYCFPFIWHASSPGTFQVPIVVSQQPPAGASGCGGTAALTLTVQVGPARPRPPVPAPGRGGVAGPVNSFAGVWDTSAGPMVVRVEGGRATGVLPGIGAAFNGIVRDGQLRGELRDQKGTASCLLTLSPDRPTFTGEVIAHGSKDAPPGRKPALTGTCVKPGNPTATTEPARTDKLTFQAPERLVTPGDVFQVPVYMLNGRGIGALNLKLHYDPQVIQPVPPPVAGNLMTGNARAEVNVRPKDEPGVAYLGFFDKDGIPAPPAGTLAVLKFRAVGRALDQTPLRIEVTTLNKGDGSKLTHERIDGAVAIVSKLPPGTGPGGLTLPPPVGGGGGSGGGPGGSGGGSGGGLEPPNPPPPPHTFGDALNALRMSVRLIDEDRKFDIVGDGPNSGPDGRVTARDAQVIAQQAALGTRIGR